MGVFLPELALGLPPQDEFANLQARIIDRTVWTYDEPNSKAKRSKLYWHDLVVPITNTTVGDALPTHSSSRRYPPTSTRRPPGGGGSGSAGGGDGCGRGGCGAATNRLRRPL